MTDRLLTDDALAAIAAQLARWERAAEHWQRHVTNPSLDEPSPAYLHEKLVEAKSEFMRSMPTAARLLLAHIRAQGAELARLRDALLDTQRLAWQLEHDGPRYYERKQSPYGEYLKCMYCGEISADAGEFRHTEKCPVRRLYEMKDARALLEGGE